MVGTFPFVTLVVSLFSTLEAASLDWQVGIFRNRRYFGFLRGTISFFTSCIKSMCCCGCSSLREKAECLEAKIAERRFPGKGRKDVEGSVAR